MAGVSHNDAHAFSVIQAELFCGKRSLVNREMSRSIVRDARRVSASLARALRESVEKSRVVARVVAVDGKAKESTHSRDAFLSHIPRLLRYITSES